MRHFVHREWKRISEGSPDDDDAKEALVNRINSAFEAGVWEAYFGEDSKIKLINPKLPAFLRAAREAGIKVGLDTGYPISIQRGLVAKLGMADMVGAINNSAP